MDYDKIKKYIEDEFCSYLLSLYNTKTEAALPYYEIAVVDVADAIMNDTEILPDTRKMNITTSIRMALLNGGYFRAGCEKFKPVIKYLKESYKGQNKDKHWERRNEYNRLKVHAPESCTMTTSYDTDICFISPPVFFIEDNEANAIVYLIKSHKSNWVNSYTFAYQAIWIFVSCFRGMEFLDYSARNTHDMLREAAKNYINHLCYQHSINDYPTIDMIKTPYDMEDGTYPLFFYLEQSYVDIFTVLNKLSSLKYEGSESNGSMILCTTSEAEDMDYIIKFKSPVDINDLTKVRKLIQTSDSQIPLVFDGRKIYGLGLYENARKNFKISFIKNYEWSLYDRECTLIYTVNHSEIKLVRNSMTKEYFFVLFQSVFSDIDDVEVQYEILIKAKKQRKGTMLVFLENPNSECKRLSKSSFRLDIESNKFINNITNIDGAIILDKHGDVYSFGVILDGLSSYSSNEDSSRGARYNSAVKYTQTVAQQCLAIVLSEDGYIDFIHKGKPINS